MKDLTSIVLLLTVSVSAEVMDKEPTLPEIWKGAAIAALVAWFLGRRLPALGWLALLPLLPALVALGESYDGYIGEAILREAGPGYIAQAHLAVGLALLGYAAGFWWRHRAGSSRSAQKLTR